MNDDGDEMRNVVALPNVELMRAVEAERRAVSTPEAEGLRERIRQSVEAYWDHLDRCGLMDDYANFPSLQVGYNGHVFEIVLRGGALDRRYVDEDPDISPLW
jgi:hypothetical protein